MKLKDIIGVTLIIGAFIGMLICAIAGVVFSFQNPDMTEMRQFLEYPEPTIWLIVCLACAWIGKTILK